MAKVEKLQQLKGGVSTETLRPEDDPYIRGIQDRRERFLLTALRRSTHIDAVKVYQIKSGLKDFLI